MDLDFSAAVYVDTSALVAIFANEASALSITDWLKHSNYSKLCSANWCVSEFSSAVSVKVRGGALDDRQADQAWQAFEDACNGDIELLEVTARDFATAGGHRGTVCHCCAGR